MYVNFYYASLTKENIKEDFIPNLRQYEKIPVEDRKALSDIKDIQELSSYVESFGEKLELPVTEEDKDIIYDDGEWLVAMPHTTEASCELGTETTWCTARTKGQNLFLNYVGSGRGIILFYVIKKHGNPRSKPNDKMSIGYVNGEVKFNQGSGNISVNAANSNLTEETFLESMHQHAGRSVSIPMIDSEYGRTYICISKRRLELRINCEGMKDFLVFSHYSK